MAGDQHATAEQGPGAMISAYGAFRLLMFALAAWSAFAGFVLVTQAFGGFALDSDDAAERIVGAHMIVLAPVYALIAWRRQAYRLFLWLPYAAQAAIVLPLLWELLTDQDLEGGVLLVVSLIFLAMLTYVWLNARDIGPFGDDADQGDELFPEEDEEADDEEEEALDERPSRSRRYRRSN
jgi:hypothetical protein